MGNRLDTLFSALLVMGASSVSAGYLYRTFVPSPQHRAGVPESSVRMPEWRTAVQIGHRLSGANDAKTTLVMFGDLQCPACKIFNTFLREVRLAHPRDLRVEYVSFPLPYHQYALKAASATECVSRRGADLGKWVDVVYAKQDSLGRKSWDDFAHEAGVTDTSGLESCVESTQAIARVNAQKRFGEQINVRGTPTVAINGWLLPGPPTPAQIDSVLRRAR